MCFTGSLQLRDRQSAVPAVRVALIVGRVATRTNDRDGVSGGDSPSRSIEALGPRNRDVAHGRRRKVGRVGRVGRQLAHLRAGLCVEGCFERAGHGVAGGVDALIRLLARTHP